MQLVINIYFSVSFKCPVNSPGVVDRLLSCDTKPPGTANLSFGYKRPVHWPCCSVWADESHGIDQRRIVPSSAVKVSPVPSRAAASDHLLWGLWSKALKALNYKLTLAIWILILRYHIQYGYVAHDYLNIKSWQTAGKLFLGTSGVWTRVWINDISPTTFCPALLSPFASEPLHPCPEHLDHCYFFINFWSTFVLPSPKREYQQSVPLPVPPTNTNISRREMPNLNKLNLSKSW